MSISDDRDPNEAWDEENPTRVTRRGEQRWGRVALHVMRDPEISMPARALYALLATYADDGDRDCYPKTSTLMDQTGASRPTIKRWVQELAAAGYVEVVARWRPNGSQASNEYVLVDTLGGSTPVTRGCNASEPPRGHTSEPPKRNTTTPNTTTEHLPPQPPAEAGGDRDDPQPALLDVDPPAQEPPVPAVVVPLDAEFDRFWAAYPRKVGKGAARKAWAKARAKASVEEIATGFRAHLPGWAARKSRGEERFIPHASTWLNEERWGDEAAAPERVTNAPAGSLSVMVEGIQRAASGQSVDPWEYARSVAQTGHNGLDSRAPGHPALPANERNQR